jgi:hypothetical protein
MCLLPAGGAPRRRSRRTRRHAARHAAVAARRARVARAPGDARAPARRTAARRRHHYSLLISCSVFPFRAAQVALGEKAKAAERVTVFVTTEQGAKYALGSLTQVRKRDSQARVITALAAAGLVRHWHVPPGAAAAPQLPPAACAHASLGRACASWLRCVGSASAAAAQHAFRRSPDAAQPSAAAPAPLCSRASPRAPATSSPSARASPSPPAPRHALPHTHTHATHTTAHCTLSCPLHPARSLTRLLLLARRAPSGHVLAQRLLPRLPDGPPVGG